MRLAAFQNPEFYRVQAIRLERIYQQLVESANNYTNTAPLFSGFFGFVNPGVRRIPNRKEQTSVPTVASVR